MDFIRSRVQIRHLISIPFLSSSGSGHLRAGLFEVAVRFRPVLIHFLHDYSYVQLSAGLEASKSDDLLRRFSVL